MCGHLRHGKRYLGQRVVTIHGTLHAGEGNERMADPWIYR